MADRPGSRQHRPLGAFLLQSGLVTPEDLQGALDMGRASGQRLGEVLVAENILSRDVVVSALSLQMDTPVVDITRLKVQAPALKLLKKDAAMRYEVLPLWVEDSSLAVGVVDLKDQVVLKELERLTKLRVKQVVSLRSNLTELIEKWYEVEKEEPTGHPAEGELSSGETAQQGPMVRAVYRLLEHAVRERASDIHIQPQTDGVHVRLRVDGTLQDWVTMPLGVHSGLISRLKVMANMNIAERRRPQDGQFTASLAGKEVDFRVATIKTNWGEMAVVRLLDKSLSILPLSQLGMAPHVLEVYQKALASPLGMILVSGPTGSGKTTTLYASLSHLHPKKFNIMTIEDPIEYQFEHINQVEVNRQAGITFASGLRGILRLDPDVILIGEIRDSETATTAIQAALTGHLVLTSVHANDAVGALLRLLDLGVEPFLVSSAVLCCISQRLVKRLCPYCRAMATPAPGDAAAYAQEMGEKRNLFYVGKGCEVCSGLGHQGRTGVFEVLRMTEGIRELLAHRTSAAEFKAAAVEEGMVTLVRDGMLKAREGITTLEEIVRQVFTLS